MSLRQSTLLICIVVAVAQIAVAEPQVHMRVVPTVNDRASSAGVISDGQGRAFPSTEAARDELRRLRNSNRSLTGTLVIELMPGIHELTRTLELGSPDSGDDDTTIVFRAAEPGKAVVRGGRAVTGWKNVTDAGEPSRLPEHVQSKVFYCDLRALGIDDFGSAAGGGVELFFRDKPMTLARWPNEGFVSIVEVVTSSPVEVHGLKGDMSGKFICEGDRPTRWVNEPDLWLHGYWFWDWSDQRMKVASIDPNTSTIALAPPQHPYGYRKGQWYYAFNALCELDTPGEWYLDRGSGKLYFWPPEPIQEGDVVVSLVRSLVEFRNVSRCSLEGVLLEAGRGDAVHISGGAGVLVDHCTIRNCLGNAVVIDGGTSHGVSHCEITQTGLGGVMLNGGDRKKLMAAGLFAEHNTIHHYSRWARMYHPAIALSGVGNRASHNLIHSAPHEAIAFGGNDHRIELNEIHNVCAESNDAGAIYAGRDWTMRGTVIQGNYLHDILGFRDRGANGVYLDDMYCGTRVRNNVFRRVSTAILLGGGRDNAVEDNVFVDCPMALHVDARALGWAKSHTDQWIAEARNHGTISGMHYSTPPYSVRYPELPGILNADPAAPRGSRIAGNAFIGCGSDHIEGAAQPLLEMHDNFSTSRIGPLQ